MRAAGKSSAPSSALSDPSVLPSVLSNLRAAYEWVILDLPPAIPFSDVPEILPYVDGALMVVRAGKTKKSLIPPTLEILGSKLWGIVLNDTVVSGGDYYGYYYRDKSRRRGRTPDAGEYNSIRGLFLRR
jgi:Mrp family chromosome partitioning ATPase